MISKDEEDDFLIFPLWGQCGSQKTDNIRTNEINVGNYEILKDSYEMSNYKRETEVW